MIRNWTTHNLIAHPLSELFYLAGSAMEVVGMVGVLIKDQVEKIHDATIPDHEPGTGRG